MAVKKTTEATIDIAPIKMGRITCHLLGVTPMIMHRFSFKSQGQLLFPKGRINAAEKAEHLKHDPLMEFRESIYRNRDSREPTAVHIPAMSFQKALAAAALDLPGASRAQILRLVSIVSTQVNLFGVPQLGMAMTRSSDIGRTPDVRTRAYFPRWCCQIEIEYVSTLLKPNQIVNLLAAAGMIVGIGDWRPQKGGPFGKYTVVDANDPTYLEIVKEGGRAAQLVAIDNPKAFCADTEELLAWFNQEAARRERIIPSAAPMALTAKRKTNGQSAQQ